MSSLNSVKVIHEKHSFECKLLSEDVNITKDCKTTLIYSYTQHLCEVEIIDIY